MIRKILKKTTPFLGDRLFNIIGYSYLHKKYNITPPKIKFHNPSRFNHKIIFLKMNYRHPDAHLYADKVEVKSIVSRLVDDKVIIPNLGVWGDPNEINFSELPDSFILKCNHGSGWNILVSDKDNIDQSRIRTTLKRWLRMNYFYVGREYQYKNIQPKILAEPLLNPGHGKSLNDYKFFCFDGEPRFVQIDFDRFSNHTRNFYDLDWNLLDFQYLYPNKNFELQQPDNFKEMIEISRKLSKGFSFIRVDLYDCAGQIYFGEMTFHPEGGFGPILPDSWDIKLGSMLNLPAKNR